MAARILAATAALLLMPCGGRADGSHQTPPAQQPSTERGTPSSAAARSPGTSPRRPAFSRRTAAHLPNAPLRWCDPH